MKAAMEPSGLVAPRLVHGDEFFGWQIGGRVVNFAWVTYRDRMLGPVPLAEAPGRAFPYNGYTLEEYRGRGLYLAVLLTMRFVLGCENVTEFVGDVEVNNTASMNGVHKAGFIPVAQLDYLTLFTHWPCLGKWAVLDPSAASLFPPVRTKGPTWWEHQKKNR